MDKLTYFKRVSIAIGLGLLLLLGAPAIVSAHSAAKDGKITAFLHISPDDKPTAGKVNDIHIYYNDLDFRFTTEGCFCKIKVTDGERTLYIGDLPAVSMRVGELKLRLPYDNVSYGVVVSGTPKTAGFFQPFNLDFDIDVGNPVEEMPKPQTQKLAIPALGAIVIAGGTASYINVRKRNDKKG